MTDILEGVPFHEQGEIALAMRALQVLKRHYPGYLWRVGVDDDLSGGIMYIMNMTLNAELFGDRTYGYVLHLTTVYADPGLKCVMRAGGEILERANLARGKFKESRSVGIIEGVDPSHQPNKYTKKIIVLPSPATPERN